jgi:glycine cleavage system H protein
MAVVEKFLGQRVEIPEDRRYGLKQGLWGRLGTDGIVFGFSRPALVLAGSVKGIEWLVEAGRPVSAGDSVAFAITGKILYVDTPVPGSIWFNETVKRAVSRITDDPYGEGWLFRIEPAGDAARAYGRLATAEAYLVSLKGSEGFKNPEGLKGGVSGMCKAVYSGIGTQKL